MSSCDAALPIPTAAAACGPDAALLALLPALLVPRGSFTSEGAATVALRDCGYDTVTLVNVQAATITNCVIRKLVVTSSNGTTPSAVVLRDSAAAVILLDSQSAASNTFSAINTTVGVDARTRAKLAIALTGGAQWGVTLSDATLVGSECAYHTAVVPAGSYLLVERSNLTAAPAATASDTTTLPGTSFSAAYLYEVHAGASVAFVNSTLQVINYRGYAANWATFGINVYRVFSALRVEGSTITVAATGSTVIPIFVCYVLNGGCLAVRRSTLVGTQCVAGVCGTGAFFARGILSYSVTQGSFLSVIDSRVLVKAHTPIALDVRAIPAGRVAVQGSTFVVEGGDRDAYLLRTTSGSSHTAMVLISNNTLDMSVAVAGGGMHVASVPDSLFSSATSTITWIVVFANMFRAAGALSWGNHVRYGSCNTGGAGEALALPSRTIAFGDCSAALPVGGCALNPVVDNMVAAHRPSAPTNAPRGAFPHTTAPLTDATFSGRDVVVAGEHKQVTVTDASGTLTFAPGVITADVTITASAQLTVVMTDATIAGGVTFGYAHRGMDVTIVNTTIGKYGLGLAPLYGLYMRNPANTRISLLDSEVHARVVGFNIIGLTNTTIAVRRSLVDVTHRNKDDEQRVKYGAYLWQMRSGSAFVFNGSTMLVADAYAGRAAQGVRVTSMQDSALGVYGSVIVVGSKWDATVADINAPTRACLTFEGNSVRTTCCADPHEAGVCECAADKLHGVFVTDSLTSATLSIRGNTVDSRGGAGVFVRAASSRRDSYLNVYGNTVRAVAVGANRGIDLLLAPPTLSIVHNNTFDVPNGFVLDAPSQAGSGAVVVVVTNRLSAATALLASAVRARLGCITGGAALLPIGHPAWMHSCAQPLPFVRCGVNTPVLSMSGLLTPAPPTTVAPPTTATPPTTAVPPTTRVPSTVAPATTAATPVATTATPIATVAPSTAVPPSSTAPATAVTATPVTATPTTAASLTSGAPPIAPPIATDRTRRTTAAPNTAAPATTTAPDTTTPAPTEQVISAPTVTIVGQSFGRLTVASPTTLHIKHCSFYQLTIELPADGSAATAAPAAAARRASDGSAYPRTIIIENVTFAAGGLRVAHAVTQTHLTIFDSKVTGAAVGVQFAGGIAQAFVSVKTTVIVDSDSHGLHLGDVGAGATVELGSVRAGIAQRSESDSPPAALVVGDVAATSSVTVTGSVLSTAAQRSAGGGSAAAFGRVLGTVDIRSSHLSVRSSANGAAVAVAAVGMPSYTAGAPCFTIADSDISAMGASGARAVALGGAAGGTLSLHRVHLRLTGTGGTAVDLGVLAAATVNVVSCDVRTVGAGSSGATGVAVAGGSRIKAYVSDTQFDFDGAALRFPGAEQSAGGVVFVGNTLASQCSLAAAATDGVYVACSAFHAPGWAKAATADCSAAAALPPCGEDAAYAAALAPAGASAATLLLLVLILIPVILLAIVVAALIVRCQIRRRRLQEAERRYAADDVDGVHEMEDVVPVMAEAQMTGRRGTRDDDYIVDGVVASPESDPKPWATPRHSVSSASAASSVVAFVEGQKQSAPLPPRPPSRSPTANVEDGAVHDVLHDV
jgi:hypothetical protein